MLLQIIENNYSFSYYIKLHQQLIYADLLAILSYYAYSPLFLKYILWEMHNLCNKFLLVSQLFWNVENKYFFICQFFWTTLQDIRPCVLSTFLVVYLKIVLPANQLTAVRSSYTVITATFRIIDSCFYSRYLYSLLAVTHTNFLSI